MISSTDFLDKNDIMKILGCSRNKAYTLIRELNFELEKEGYYVIQGKVNRKKFEDKFIYNPSKDNEPKLKKVEPYF